MPTSSHETLNLSTGPTQVLWRRSARARKISLRIDARAGIVIITLPPRAAQAAGLALLRDNTAWVAERLARLPDPVLLADGVVVPIDGVPHRIRHVPGGCGGAWLGPGELLVSGAPEFLARRAADFLRAEARRRLSALAVAKAATAGLSPRRVIVKDTRTRWGSCTADGTLMFCWRLVMAPPHVQDYVAAHEVAHLRHMDHGRGFWALVAQLTPNKRMAVHWLDAQGPGLMRVGSSRAASDQLESLRDAN
jgi:predicted metal-dependent hydrolase